MQNETAALEQKTELERSTMENFIEFHSPCIHRRYNNYKRRFKKVI